MLSESPCTYIYGAPARDEKYCCRLAVGAAAAAVVVIQRVAVSSLPAY